MFSYTQNLNLMIASGSYPDMLSGIIRKKCFRGGKNPVTEAADLKERRRFYDI